MRSMWLLGVLEIFLGSFSLNSRAKYSDLPRFMDENYGRGREEFLQSFCEKVVCR